MKNEAHGNLTGIRDSMLARLTSLYDERVEAGLFLPRGLMKTLAELTGLLNREISIYITRGGEVIDVAVGTDSDVELADVRLRRREERLSCVRCVHTHPNGDGRLSDVDLSALRANRYDAMVAVGCLKGEPTWVQAAFLVADDEILLPDPVRWYRVPDGDWLEQVRESDALVDATVRTRGAEKRRERAVLMGIESDESLQELARLAETAGAEVVGSFLQRRPKADSALLIGRGRADELAKDCQALEADLCIFDEELTGIQARNLEDLLRVRVVDRTALILDIFAQRAASAEGKLQVELAQLQYRSARLIGLGTGLSRLAGGIGTRGPGESRLEIDRRRIRERVTELRRRLDEVEKQRAVRRRGRERSGIPAVALVGYTNAGKSSLLNALAGADALAEDKLFATLDTVSRRCETAEHTPYLLTDTVGFIRKLPHDLVSAFRSTLEEAALADVLVIVSDGASDRMREQRETVEQVLAELGASDQPRIEVINKCDLGGDFPFLPGAVLTSAKTGKGLDVLRARIAAALQETVRTVTVFLPFSRGGDLAAVRAMGRTLGEEWTDEGTRLTLALSADAMERVAARFGDIFVREEA